MGLGALGQKLMSQALVCMRVQSCVTLFATLWPVARQAPVSMGFFRQEYWSGLPFPSPGNLPEPGIEPVSPPLAGGFSRVLAGEANS